MLASTQTLAAALGLIPKVLFMRYGGANDYTFGKAKANAVIQDMEKEFDSDYYKREYPLIILDGVTDYEIPTTIRKFRGLYEVPADWVIPDKEHPISVELIETRLRLLHTPVVNNDQDILNKEVDGAFPVGSKNGFYDTSELGPPKTDNQFRSALCRYTVGATGITHSRIIISNDPANAAVTLNGDLPAAPVTPNGSADNYSIYHNYYVIEALDYITRVTNENNALPIAQDWEELFVAGLRFYYEKQTDQESSNYRDASFEYNRLLKKAAADEKRKQGTHPKPKPRDIPDFNKHDSSTRFGPHSTTF